MNTCPDMRRYIVRISYDGGTGLGVVCGEHILTCAHFYDVFKVDLLLTGSLQVEVPALQETGEFWVQTIDAALDFMVLGDQPLNHEVIEDSRSPELSEIEPAIRPARLVFPPESGPVTLPGYFFAPDGVTRVDTILRIHPCSHGITVIGNDVVKGSSGGPIFTADHHLIGIVQAMLHAAPILPNSGHGTRLDMAATGWLCHQLGGLDEYCATGTKV